ncbi:MAG TPA: GNAT family N-acetyltransferase [Solirubrobacterales bacterium]|jgi:ribosomal protein S18 acetylase RimI-like enzyme|nr:GNAT family N-acetyltransferase [Solirubrobacterales bacterium]
MTREVSVRRASEADAGDVARLLHDFNTEFDDYVPELPVLTERVRRHVENEESTFLLVGAGPDGVAQLRFRASLMLDGLEAYLQELYVAPALRGKGLGRALLEAVMEEARSRGAVWMDLGTSEDDAAARGLYESLGFTNRENGPDAPIMYVYERAL